MIIPDKTTFNEIFDSRTYVYLQIFDDIINEIKQIEYSFTYIEYYGKVLKEDVPEGHKIYWSEIINNAHIASLMSIHRQVDWVNAMVNSYNAENYLNFCASLRGFLESVADTNYSLKKVPNIILKYHGEIESAIKKLEHNKSNTNEPYKFVTCSELEEDLLHFNFARKLRKEEISPSYHIAQSNTSYINSLNDPEYLDLYAFLCQVTHPAMPTILKYFDLSEDPDGYKQKIDLLNDKSAYLISELIKEYKDKITDLIKIGFNIPYMILKAINELHHDFYYIKTLDSLGFNKNNS